MKLTKQFLGLAAAVALLSGCAQSSSQEEADAAVNAVETSGISKRTDLNFPLADMENDYGITGEHLFYEMNLYEMMQILLPTASIHPRVTEVITAEDGTETEVEVPETFEGIFLIGFAACPWCQEAVPVLHEVSQEFGVPVYYLDRRSDINLENPHWDRAVAAILGHLMDLRPHPETGFPNMWVPEVLHLRGAEVISHHQGTFEGHERVWDEASESYVLPELDASEIKALKQTYREIFQGLVNP